MVTGQAQTIPQGALCPCGHSAGAECAPDGENCGRVFDVPCRTLPNDRGSDACECRTPAAGPSRFGSREVMAGLLILSPFAIR